MNELYWADNWNSFVPDWVMGMLMNCVVSIYELELGRLRAGLGCGKSFWLLILGIKLIIIIKWMLTQYATELIVFQR
jgi:hypothetical protein